MSHRDVLLSFYERYPFERHPLWVAVAEGRLSSAQILQAETQHYLRTRAGRKLRGQAVKSAEETSETLLAAIFETYLEECDPSVAGPSHLELIARLLREGGVAEEDFVSAAPTPGNAAAIALYSDIARRGPACHIIGAGVVEHFYAKLSPRIYDAYTSHYGMSAIQAETYRIHGALDELHAERAFRIIDEAVLIHGQELVYLSVRDAFVATCLHYDGMLQAADTSAGYWAGRVE